MKFCILRLISSLLLLNCVKAFVYLFSQDRRLQSNDFAILSRHKIALDEAVQRFNGSNRSLRSFLLDRKDLEINIGNVGEQRDLLLTKLTRMQDEQQVTICCISVNCYV